MNTTTHSSIAMLLKKMRSALRLTGRWMGRASVAMVVLLDERQVSAPDRNRAAAGKSLRENYHTETTTAYQFLRNSEEIERVPRLQNITKGCPRSSMPNHHAGGIR